MRRRKKIILGLTVAVLAIGSFQTGRYYVESNKKDRQAAQKKRAWNELVAALKNDISQFPGEVGIVIKELKTGWAFSHDHDVPFPSASVAKVPLMAACFLAADECRIDLTQEIALKDKDKMTGSGLLKVLPNGMKFSIERLIGLMIYESDNTATNMLTTLLGREHLDATFKELGLTRTNLARRIADYAARDKGIENYVTASDMAFLLEKIYRKEIGSERVSNQCLGLLNLTRAQDRIPKYLPPEITIAHKAGIERGVCHDAGIVYTQNGALIIVVLTKHTHESSVLAREFIALCALRAYVYATKEKKT